nr:retrovirus-related Pol polyprotein from transposon TNT 1-94 [Tanacetum cinerariifolium]
DYWKIIRLGGHTAVYKFFVDMLNQFDIEDLNQLWTLVKETLSIRQASSDKEKELWVELKRLCKFDAKADDGYFLRYSFVSKAFKVFNTRRQQFEETYHVTFDESMEAIRQYQANSYISYYVIPHGRSLTELTQEKHIPEVIAPNEPDIPLTEDTKGLYDLINIKGTHEQNVQNVKIITQPTEGPSRNNTEVSVSISESLVPDVPQSLISNQASTSSYMFLKTDG